MLKKNILFILTALLLVAAITVTGVSFLSKLKFSANAIGEEYIKWVEFDIPYSAMEKALNLDITTKESGCHMDWVTTLAYLGTKYGGNWKKYKSKDMDQYVVKCKDGKTAEELCENSLKYYRYFYEAYDAVLGGMVGEYQIATPETAGTEHPEMTKKYGLKAYSPIAYA